MAEPFNKSNREHSFDFELAAIVGIEKAILLKNIDYWVKENERRKQTQYFSNEMWWTEESLSSLAAKYPYMKRASIGRWMSELHESGWVCMVGVSGTKNRYSVGRVFELWNENGDWQKELSQNETVVNRPKMRHQPSQNETPTVSKWDTNRPKMGYNNIDNNVELNVELNDKADKPPKPSKPKAEKKEKQPPAVIHRMVDVFEKEHQQHFKDSSGTWIGFTWQQKEFGALSSLKSEFEKRLQRRGAECSDDAIVQGWQTFLEMAAKADKFIIQKWFTPTKLWSNFQGIINSITAQNGKATSTNQQQPSKAERQLAAFDRIVRDAQENGLRGRTNFGATFSDTVPNQGV